jgi:formylglycine-generating enzyme required for sulfatase activity
MPTTIYPWGDDIKLNGQVMANCLRCGSKWDGEQTAPVGSFAPNNFGLYDMVGNASAWIEDCGHLNYEGAPVDGSAWTSGDCKSRMIRGSSYHELPDTLRVASRQSGENGARDQGLSFRVARTLATAASPVPATPGER